MQASLSVKVTLRILPVAAFLVALIGAPAGAPAQSSTEGAHTPHAGMLLYPDISQEHIVFVYANDVWIAPRDGGMALPLARPRGREAFPRFSPDGKTVAFMGNYDGNLDLYTIPVGGGIPFRVTHHPASERLCDWTPDGEQLLFYFNGLSDMRRKDNIFVVDAKGGLPQKLPVPYGTVAALSPDGNWLAYTPNTRDTRTWKRYRGGMATDIWLFHLQSHQWKPITEWEGTDTQPMWHGSKVYFLSDAGPHHRLNIWSYDTTNGERKQVTTFTQYDCKWPSIGPGDKGQGEIILQNGPDLHRIDLATGDSTQIKVTIPGDRVTIRPKRVDVSKFMQNAGISPTGKRILVQARGDIWSVAASNGPPLALTRTDGQFERDPAWSPDGRWVAYLSDATGEYELYVTPSDGSGEPRQVTKGGKLFRMNPVWSPDSKLIAFSEKSGALFLCDVATGKVSPIDTDLFAQPMQPSWSHDSSWIAYAKNGENRQSSIWLYDVRQGKKHQVTSGLFNDGAPVFDRKGDFLYFSSNRRFTSPEYDEIGTSFVYTDTSVLLCVPLRKDLRLPPAPTIDVEPMPKKDRGESKGQKPAAKTSPAGQPAGSKPASLAIDLEGFESRAVMLPLPPGGSYGRLAVAADGKLLFAHRPHRGSSVQPSIKAFDWKSKRASTVVEGATTFDISADGKKLLVVRGTTLYVIAAAPGQKLAKSVSLSGLEAVIDPRAEWKQILVDAWRIMRDYFYDPNMHGVDWPKTLKQYQPMLADCATREDVAYVIGEMIAELNVGHAYVRGLGDTEEAPSVAVGLLGCDFALENNAYRIKKIYTGGAHDADARGALSEPGVGIREGDYLLEVNGTPVDTGKDPWAAFVGLAGKTCTLTVSTKPKKDASARTVVLKTLPSESSLRYRAWVEANRRYVEERTKGQVGYIHVPDTGLNGQNELYRQFFGQRHKAALIIDERWNGGGQIPTRFIELLNRPVTNYWATRHGRDWVWPPDAHQGPKCMLINGMSGSGGDAFPAYFRQAKLGKLIGRRTWGGLVGISGNPSLIDGGTVSAPTFAYYDKDGTWGIEGHGVDPDIEVMDDPSKMVDGGDPQLDAAIELMLEEIRKHPYRAPKRPPYPNRAGFGIAPEDK